jgi:CheY-like chemotaxis protein
MTPEINRYFPLKQRRFPFQIYLVEDDLVFLQALKQVVCANQEIPLSVKSFQSGEACLEEINKSSPDLIILDYFLDSKISMAMTGFHLLGLIKTKNKKTQVIFLSGQGNASIAASCIKAGANEYIAKDEIAFCKIQYLLKTILHQDDLRTKTNQYLAWNVACAVCMLLMIASLLVFQSGMH